MPQYFITFRAHPNDAQLFEDFLTLFLPKITSSLRYVYVVEKDNTPEKHFHCVIEIEETKSKNNPMKQYLMGKKWKAYSKFLRFTETDEKHAIVVKTITKLDAEKTFEYYVGYCYKEDNVSRRDTNLNQNDVLNALSQYQALKRIEINTPKNDWTYIKSNNIHMYIEQFMEKHKEVNFNNFQLMMVKQKYSFVNITSKQFEIALAEIKVARDIADPVDLRVLRYHKNNLKSIDLTPQIVTGKQP